MSTSQIRAKVARILAQHFLVPVNAIKERRRLQDLGLTPFEQLEMLLYLETEFKINLDDQEARSIQTFGDAVSSVQRHKLGVAYA